MEWCAHGQQLGTLGPAFVGEFRGAFDGGGMPRDYNLLGRVEVGRIADFALGCVVAYGGNFFHIHAENGCHRAHAHRHGLLHVLAAVSDGTDGISEADSAGRDVGRIFAQAVASDIRRLWHAALQHAQGCDGSRQDRWLCDLCQAELLFWPFKA